ncbi:MAG: serine protease, partial [Frankiaceae bacterium]|nr:serine protease [Frankiaceae bacterium]
HGAKVINLSLGSQQYSDVEAAAVAQAQAAGVVVVAAAGNDGTSTPNYPAALPNVLSVGATDASGSQASFSSYGSWVKVGAPGTSIYSTTPTAGSDFFAPGSYDTSDGTSFASPIVAAEVALLAAYAPGSDAATLRGAITSSAHAVSGAQLGAGEVDFATALSHLPPQSTPTFTAPTAAATVGGPVALTVTSGSPSVRFSVDGVTVGSLVSVSSDTAQISWSSWGVGNGSHTLGAADCNTFGCGPAATESVDVENSAPSLVAPAAAEVVAGAVTVTATSDAPAVRFAADGATLTTVATTSGTAGTSWMTWGVANGTHALTATACDGVGNCAAQSASRSVTIANAAPAITSPTSGQSVGGTFAVTATAPGGGVAVLVDGTRRGFDGSAPYSIPINWSAYADGTHTVSAVSCDQTGTVCNGPAAPAVSFVVKSLHPSISGAISPFSPNGDGRRDSSTLVLHIADTETAVWRVYNASNVAVVSVRSLGTLAKGDHSFVWNGRSSSGSLVPNGAYTIVVSTTARVSGSTLVGTASRSVRVDTVAPSITAVRGANSRVYPVKDGYRDSVTLGATVSEPGSLTARIYNPAGALVRTLVLSAPGAGAYSIGWTGRSASGALLPAGAYHFAITAADVAGNRRTTSRYAVTVSLAKLVTKTLTLTKAGDSAFEAGGSSPCAGADASVSDYPNGLWLGNACDPEWDGPYEIAAAFYTFSLPAALAYTGLKFQAYGYSFYAPSEIDGAAYNYGSATYDSLRSYAAGDTPGWYTMSTPAVTGHVSSTRVAKFAFDVADDPSGVADFDIDVVRLVVTYQVLG